MKASKRFPDLTHTDQKKRTISTQNRERAKARRRFFREKTYIKQQSRCAYCGKTTKLVDWTVDHIIPISKGGLSEEKNVVGACITCNGVKGNNIFKTFKR